MKVINHILHCHRHRQRENLMKKSRKGISLSINWIISVIIHSYRIATAASDYSPPHFFLRHVLPASFSAFVCLKSNTCRRHPKAKYLHKIIRREFHTAMQFYVKSKWKVLISLLLLLLLMSIHQLSFNEVPQLKWA